MIQVRFDLTYVLVILVLAVLGVVALAGIASAEIRYVGSATIGENILPAAAQAFTTRTGIRFGAVEIQGSGKGLEQVVRGEAELAGVARGLTPTEKERRVYYQVIGYDAVGVFVHPSNSVRSLTRAQLKAIYSGAITNWKDVGGPDRQTVVITQVWGGGRGQMVEFHEDVMDGAAFRADRRELDRQPEQVTALMSEPGGITAVSLAVRRPGIKAMAIQGYAPEPAHVRSGAYLLSRPLLLVAVWRPSPDVRRFLTFMLSDEGQAIVARRFVPVR